MNYKSLNTLFKVANKFANQSDESTTTVEYDLYLTECEQDSDNVVTCPAVITFSNINFGLKRHTMQPFTVETEVKFTCGLEDETSVAVGVSIEIDDLISKYQETLSEELSEEKLESINKKFERISSLMEKDFKETEIFRGIESTLLDEEEQGAMQDERDESREAAELGEPSAEPSDRRHRMRDRHEKFTDLVVDQDDEMPF